MKGDNGTQWVLVLASITTSNEAAMCTNMNNKKKYMEASELQRHRAP